MFETIKQAKNVIELLELAQNLDEDHDNKKDLGEFIVLGTKLMGQVGEAQDTLGEIQRLFGADLLAVKEKLGLKE